MSDKASSDENEAFVFLHRMPYMKMNQTIKTKVNRYLFVFMLVIAFTWIPLKSVYNFFITFQTPFDLFIVPGVFFYWRYKEKWVKEDVDVIKVIQDFRVSQVEQNILSRTSSNSSFKSLKDENIIARKISKRLNRIS